MPAEERGDQLPIDVLAARLQTPEAGLAVAPVSPHLSLSRLTSAFDAPPAVRERATELVALAVASGVATGKNPASVAGAALSLDGVEQLRGYRQADVAEAAGVTDVSLRQRYYDLEACCEEIES